MPFWQRVPRATVLGIALTSLSHVAGAVAAELKILTPRSMWTVLKEIGPQFEASSGYKLTVVTDVAAPLADRIIQGEPFDIFIGPPVQMNRVVQNNKVLADSSAATVAASVQSPQTTR